jgi:hypothetical protein
MSFVLNYTPGQQVTFVFETLDGYGERADGYAVPYVSRIIFPNLSLAACYPQNMIRLDVGLFTFQFVLPKNAASIGSYIVDIVYYDPDTGLTKNTFCQVVCNAPYGLYSAGTGGGDQWRGDGWDDGQGGRGEWRDRWNR